MKCCTLTNLLTPITCRLVQLMLIHSANCAVAAAFLIEPVMQKTYLKGLQTKGLKIFAAYGNTATDVRAYKEAGIKPEMTFIMGSDDKDKDKDDLSQRIPNWEQCGYHMHLKDVRGFPDATVPIPYFSLDWYCSTV